MEAEMVLTIVIVVILLLVFNRQISYLLGALKNTATGVLSGPSGPALLPCGCEVGRCNCALPDEGSPGVIERITNPGDNPAEDTEVAEQLGYEGTLPWTDVLKSTELDPATHDNHRQFVADVRRFSSGANFTSVNDDNTNAAFTNFVGLRRPQHVHIGWDARQQPDIDQSVLQRNKTLQW